MTSAAVVLDDLRSLPQVAERLGLHRATVNDMVIAGRLKAYRLGAHWYVRAEDLECFAAAYQRPKNSPRRRSATWADHWKTEIVRWLHHWNSATADELARVIDLHVGNIRKYLALLEQEREVLRDDDGLWLLTDSGNERAAAMPTPGQASD